MTDFQLNPLSQSQRIQALKTAKKHIVTLAGRKPERRDFNNSADQKYPQWVTLIVLALCGVMLIFAFIPSAIRLYDEGSRTFERAIADSNSAMVAGISIVMFAETGAVLFTLALSVLEANTGMRWVLAGAALLSGAIALIGNVAVAIFRHAVFSNVFVWFEALAPPILTLATAYVLKTVALNAIAQRHADNQMYRAKLAEWERQSANPEQHPQFTKYYANELRDALTKANKKFSELLDELTDDEWREYVQREFMADQWYENNSLPRPRIRTNAYSPAAKIRVDRTEIRTNSEFAPNSTNGYSKNMSARQKAYQFFIEQPQYIHDKQMTLDMLIEIVSAHWGEPVGRTSIHEARNEARQVVGNGNGVHAGALG